MKQLSLVYRDKWINVPNVFLYCILRLNRIFLNIMLPVEWNTKCLNYVIKKAPIFFMLWTNV